MRQEMRILRWGRPCTRAVAVLLVAGGLAIAGCGGQTKMSALDAALAAIKPAVIKSHVRFLAHDLLRGRNTGEPGYDIAAQFVASQFERIGLQPLAGGSYLQPVDLLVATQDMGSELRAGGVVLRAPEAAFVPDWLGQQPTVTADGVYVGYGVVTRERDDYGGMDVKGKIVFVLSGLPPGWADDPAKVVLGRMKNELAHRRGAAAVVSLAIPDRKQAPRPPSTRLGLMVLADGTAPSFRPEVAVSGLGAARLFAAWGIEPEEVNAAVGSPPRPVGLVTIARSYQTGRVQTWNVIGILPGQDPQLKEQAVVFTAHLDHLGVGQPDGQGDAIFNGARDNAIGVARMLAAAEALVRLRPRRSVVFAAVAAEERGMAGSWHLVKHGPFPVERTAAVINQDGGRVGAPADDVFAYGAEFSTLGETLETVAKQAGMSVSTDTRSPFPPSAALVFRGDQYPFLVAGVPGMYLMDAYSAGGDPEAGRKEWLDYIENVVHTQRDNFSEAWSFESPARVAALAVRLAWHLANSDAMPKMKETSPFPKSRGVPAQSLLFGSAHAVGTRPESR